MYCFSVPLLPQIFVPVAALGGGFKALSIFFEEPRKAFEKISLYIQEKGKMLLIR